MSVRACVCVCSIECGEKSKAFKIILLKLQDVLSEKYAVSYVMYVDDDDDGVDHGTTYESIAFQSYKQAFIFARIRR